jgi:hypothetical protein
MSAFIVSNTQINAIVRAASRMGLSYQYAGMTRRIAGMEQEVAEMLLCANYDSVNARYRESNVPREIIYAIDAPLLDAISAIKLANSLAYQSCEFDEWEASESKAFTDALVSWAVNKLPGYDAAPWTIDDDEPAGPVGLVETMNAMKKAGKLIVVNVGDKK